MEPKRSILITGCSSGMGYESALALKERGWRVFASARKIADVERLKSEGFEAVFLDLADNDSIHMALNWVLHRNEGRLDALFNNAAFAVPAAVEDLSVAALRHQFEACFFGWHELTISVLRIMRRQGYGRIVQNSSVLGLVSMPYRGAYAANKFAIEGLSDALRLELRDTDIHVSSIECGPMRSQFRHNAHQQFKKWVQQEHSFHHAAYRGMLERFQSEKPEPFTLPAAAVVPYLLHALEHRKPKTHYYVTRATWILTTLKRFLPYCCFERILLRLAKQEQKRYR